jgi:hypothetical protein
MDNGYMQVNGGKGNPATNPQYSVPFISASCLPTSSTGDDGYKEFYITFYQNPYYYSVTVDINYVSGSNTEFGDSNNIYVTNYSGGTLNVLVYSDSKYQFTSGVTSSAVNWLLATSGSGTSWLSGE